MANTKLGKQWEQKFKESWKKSFPDTFIYRLPDQLSRYRGASTNPCDFICFNGRLYLLEVKEHKGNTFPFSAFPQYERLLEYKDMRDVIPGVVIWFSEKDEVVFVHIKECEKMVSDGLKSINVKMLNSDEYKVIRIPSKKKRVFLDCDFTLMKEV